MLYTITLPKLTRESLATTDFASDDILEIIRNLKPNEPTVRISLVSGWWKSVMILFAINFSSCLESGKFHGEWKKANEAPDQNPWEVTLW